jgi:small subunit ribosomal protein S24e
VSSGSEKVTKIEGGELRVVAERYNSVVKRLEVEAVVTHQGSPTPSRKILVGALASLYSKSPELVVVKKVLSELGMGVSRVQAYIYDDVERLKKFEPEYMLKRHGVGG